MVYNFEFIVKGSIPLKMLVMKVKKVTDFFRIFFCVVLPITCLIAGCSVSNNSDRTGTGAPTASPSEGESNGAAVKEQEGALADVLNEAVLGAKISYFDSKFGAGVKKDDELTIGYMDGKIRVTENQGYAFNIFNPYVDRGEAPGPDEALEFIKQFLPKDAVPVKEDENKETGVHTFTYSSEALKDQTGLAGQLNIDIYKDPSDSSKVRQAQISIDITANM